METITAKHTDSYVIEYMVYESKCPKCGAIEEHHLEREANFFKKDMKCYKCEHKFTVESEDNQADSKPANCAIFDVSISLPSDEEIREPIQNALYSTDRLTTDQCTELADGILTYLNESGFKVVRQ